MLQSACKAIVEYMYSIALLTVYQGFTVDIQLIIGRNYVVIGRVWGIGLGYRPPRPGPYIR